MPSLSSLIFNLMLRLAKAQQLMTDLGSEAARDPAVFQAIVNKARARSDLHQPRRTVIKGFQHTEIDIDGFALHTLTQPAHKRVLLSLHGGAYVIGPNRAHWPLVVDLARRSGHDLALFDYPKAPEHHCQTTIGRTLACYDAVVARYGAENVVLMGESSGGGLALALAMRLRELGQALPRMVLLLYPWLDVTLSHPDVPALQEVDLVLERGGLIACGKVYAGELAVTDPQVSPWFGSAENLPPLHIFSGTHDMLHAEARDFVAKAQAAGSAAHFYSYREMQHAWLLGPLPETSQAREQIVSLLR